MPKKESAKKQTLTKLKNGNKVKEDSKKKLIIQKGEELAKWRIKNATQKRFFSLEEKEQKLLEITYVVFLQIYPELIREDFLDRVRKADNRNAITKSVAKSVMKKAVLGL